MDFTTCWFVRDDIPRKRPGVDGPAGVAGSPDSFIFERCLKRCYGPAGDV